MNKTQKRRCGALRYAVESLSCDAEGWPDDPTQCLEWDRCARMACDIYVELADDGDPWAENWCDFAGAFAALIRAAVQGNRDPAVVKAFDRAHDGLPFVPRRYSKPGPDGKPLPRFDEQPCEVDPLDSYDDDWSDPPGPDFADWHRRQSAQRN
jgi:hypothetical protein